MSWSHKRGTKILVFQKHLRPQSKERTTIKRKLIQAHHNFCHSYNCFECSPSNKKELVLEAFPRFVTTATNNPVFVRSAPSCAWSSPTHSYKKAPHFQQIPSQRGQCSALPPLPKAVPRLSRVIIYQPVKRTKLIILVHKMCLQNYLIIST